MSHADNPADATLREFLGRLGKKVDFDASTSLYGEGLGLDSLEVAELSVLLEDTHGSDPFSAGQSVTTVGDVLAFYAPAA